MSLETQKLTVTLIFHHDPISKTFMSSTNGSFFIVFFFLLLQAVGQADGVVPQLRLLHRGVAAWQPGRPPQVPVLRHPRCLPVRRSRMRLQGAQKVHGQAPD